MQIACDETKFEVKKFFESRGFKTMLDRQNNRIHCELQMHKDIWVVGGDVIFTVKKDINKVKNDLRKIGLEPHAVDDTISVTPDVVEDHAHYIHMEWTI